MVNTKVTLCGIPMDNPIIPASGTFGFGYEFAEIYDINILGTFSTKGTTKEPRFGNPTPRIAECEAGMLNSVGLQNPGVDKVISEELPKLSKCFHKKVIANVSGFSVGEDAETCGLLDREYRVTKEHSDRYWESESADILRAESYDDVVSDLLILIGRHTESATLRLYQFPDDAAAVETAIAYLTRAKDVAAEEVTAHVS